MQIGVSAPASQAIEVNGPAGESSRDEYLMFLRFRILLGSVPPYEGHVLIIGLASSRSKDLKNTED